MSTSDIYFSSGHHYYSIESFYEHLIDTAAGIVAGGGSVLAPLTFVLSNDGKVAIIPPPASKEALAHLQKTIVQEPLVRACAIVFEAWTSRHEKPPVPHIEPRLDPNRKEAIVVSIMTAGRQALMVSPIERPSNVVQKAAFEWLDEAEGKHMGRFVR